MQALCAFRGKITGHGNNKEMRSELQQQIIRSLLACLLIRDLFRQICCRVLIRCFNEIQVGKAGEADPGIAGGGVGSWAATGHVVGDVKERALGW